MSDQLLVPDWEKTLEAFCDPDGVEEFFNIRNAVRQAMRDRGALLAQMRRIQFVIKPDLLRVLAKEQDRLGGIVAQRRATMLRDFADLFEDIFAALPEHLRGDIK